MEVNRTEKITFRCTALEKAALAEQAARCGISTSEYCRTLALGGRPKERYTEEERELFREIARLKGTVKGHRQSQQRRDKTGYGQYPCKDAGV